jgi:hypothetical protein
MDPGTLEDTLELMHRYNTRREYDEEDLDSLTAQIDAWLR